MNDLKIVSQEVAVKQGASAAISSAPGSSAVAEARSSEASKQVNVPSASAQQGVEASEQRVEEAVANLNEYVQSVQRDLQFRLDDNSGKTVITVYDRSTEEVVRQIPDDVVLRLARDLQQDVPISLFNAKV
jgi:flagellar protein FlaG